jgi:hypothetical protein
VRPRDRLKGHPQERQHSAATWRDAGPSAPGKGFRILVRDGMEARRAETRNPDSSGIQGTRLATARSGEAGRAQALVCYFDPAMIRRLIGNDPTNAKTA